MNLIKKHQKVDDMESVPGRMMNIKRFSESSKEAQSYICSAAVVYS